MTKTLFQQHKKGLYTWTPPDAQYQNQIDYIFSPEDGQVLYSQQKQDLELTVAQIMKLFAAKFKLNIQESRENH